MLPSQYLRRRAIGIGHIDDGLTLPVRQRFCDISVRLETDRQEDDVRLDRVRQFFGDDRGSDRGRICCKAFRVTRGCNGYFDAVAGKRLGQGLADIAEPDNCVAHIARQICARPPSTATSLPVMKLLSDDARKAAAAPTSAGSPMRWSAVIEP